MTVIFRSTPVNVPFTFDSIGNHWDQPPVSRPKGYPCYHYLQTETGCGRVVPFSFTRARVSFFPPLSVTVIRRKATAGAPALPLLPARWKAASRQSSAAGQLSRWNRNRARRSQS